MAGIKRVLFAGMAIVGLTQLVWAEVPDLAEKLAAVAALGDLTHAPAMYVDDASTTSATLPSYTTAWFINGLDGKPMSSGTIDLV